MKNKCYKKPIIRLSKEKALELLYNSEKQIIPNDSCFDKYGNYSFPTDLVVNTPNTAIGSPLGLSIIKK